MAIVLAHYGAWVPLPELRRRCQVSEHGVNALSLVQTGKHYGLAIRAMRLRPEDLRHVVAPVILFWEYQHFLVLEGIRGDFAWVNDPARGHRRLSLSALRKGYSGVALIAQPGPAFRALGNPRQPFRTIAAMLRPGRWWLALLAAAVLAESLLLPLMILLLGDAIGDELTGRTADWRSLALVLTGLLTALVSQHSLTDFALGAVTHPTLRQLIDELADAPASFVQLRQPATLVDRLQLAEYPALTAVHIVMAGIRLTVAVPLFVLILARIHLFAGILALAALTAPFFMQQLTGRTATSFQGNTSQESLRQADQELDILRRRRRIQANGENLAALSHVVCFHATMPPAESKPATWLQRLVTLWPILRPCIELSPIIAVGAETATNTNAVPTVIVALLASWFAFRQVESAAESIGMLYMLPESIVQLLDIAQERDVAEQAA